MSDTKLLDRLKAGNGPIRKFLKGTPLTSDNLAEEQNKLAVSFASGLEEILQLPKGSIDVKALNPWILNTIRSFVKPEHWSETIEPTQAQMQDFGRKLGQILNAATVPTEEITQESEQLQPTEQITEENQQTLLERARNLIAIDR